MFVDRTSADRMEVTGWLEPPKSTLLDHERGTPSLDYPSDHFALAYDIEFKRP